jgi:glucose 1-dehydrogenase
MPSLQGKVALITGASRGIGRGIAEAFAAEGADVVVNYRTHADEAQAVADRVAALGGKALVVQADVADRAAVRRMFDAAIDHFGHLDIAVANAAHSVRERVIDAKWENVLRTIEVTQFGVFHTCQFAAQQMVKQGLRGHRSAGKIIVISSIHEELGFPTSAAYNMAKAAVNHLVRTMAAELTPYHINVNVINPGWIDTPGERTFYTEEDIQKGAQRLPWKRLGTIEDIGQGAVYLASDAADYVTGTTLRIDGGFMIGLSLPGGTGS